MGKMSREKGKRGEREVAAILRDFGYDAKRGQQFKGGPNSPDVLGLPGVHIEVKRVERLQLYDAISQAKRDAGNDLPVVLHRKNGCEWVAIQPMKDWIKLYQAWELGNGEK